MERSFINEKTQRCCVTIALLRRKPELQERAQASQEPEEIHYHTAIQKTWISHTRATFKS